MSRATAALAAGGMAIVANTLALDAADFVPLATAHGGLLKLFLLLTGIQAGPIGPVAQNAFHILVGLAMALVYAEVLERRLPGPPWLGGLLYAAAVWLLNACVVLPLLGEGFAGSRTLTVAGMVWFAAAHTLFFWLLAVLYAGISRTRRLAGPRTDRPCL